jgi:nucleotide-binding universal stress UspA family protein
MTLVRVLGPRHAETKTQRKERDMTEAAATESPAGHFLPRRVVVDVDGSPESKLALRWGAYLAAGFGAELTALAVWDYPYTWGVAAIPLLWNPTQDLEDVFIDACKEVFGAEPPHGLRLIMREGDAARVLIDASRNALVLVLVLGSRGHGGFGGLLLGSVSMKATEHAKCSVFVIHGDKTPPGARP